MNTKQAGKIGGKNRKINFTKTRLELVESLMKLVKHRDDLLQVLAEKRSNKWLEAFIDELRQ